MRWPRREWPDRMLVLPWLALAGLLLGCGDASGGRPLQEATVSVSVTGLSGLTRDGSGTLFSIAERDRAVVAIEGGTPRVIPLRGVPDGVDLEAIAWLEGTRFIIASESADADRAEDLLFVVEVGGAHADVVETIPMPYAAVGATPADNDGIEGLCVVDGIWIAAIEHPHEGLATLAVRDVNGGWSGRDVRLTSTIGKLSALDCHRARGGIRVWAIERGIERSVFGDEWVARVLWFRLPEPGRLAIPQIASDLSGRVPGQPNPEGLAMVDDELWIVTDNHYRVQVGETRLLRVPVTARLLHPPP